MERAITGLIKPHKNTLAPSRPITAAGGLLLGLIVQGPVPSLSSGPSGWFALGFRLKLVSLCFLKQW